MPTESAPPHSGFHIRNWWRNGVACRLTVILALLILANLFEPWTPDYVGAGYSETHWEGNEIVRRNYEGVKAKGTENAFALRKAWLPLAGVAVILYACGRLRNASGSLRWLPAAAAVCISLYLGVYLHQRNKEDEEWLKRFWNPPVVTPAPAANWALILSLGAAISGALYARGASRPAAQLPPPPP